MKAIKTGKQPSRTSEIAIFGRILEAGKGNLSRDLARYVLTLGFGEADQVRMGDLATRNQEGTLLPEEQEELRSFVQASHLLALLHSKARKSLSTRRAS